MKYIDSEKLIAEIKRRIEINERKKRTEFGDGVYSTCKDFLSLITSLQQEQPEIDFDEAYKSYMESRKDDLSGNAVTVNMKDLARYCYELGLNTRKQE